MRKGAQGRRPRAARPQRHRGDDAGGRGAGRPDRGGHPLRRRAGRPRWPGQRLARVGQAQGSRLRAARRARPEPRTSSSSSRASPTPRWSASRPRASEPDRGAVGGPAEDRRLPVHDAGPQPRRGAGRRHDVHDRGRPRPDPRCSQGKGLGLEFLRHVERCSVLVHVLDCATFEPGRDPLTDLEVIEAELREVPDLAVRPPAPRRPQQGRRARGPRPRRHRHARPRGPRLPVFASRRSTHEGLRELRYALAELIEADRAAKPVEEATRIVLRPTAVDDLGFTVEHARTARLRRPRRQARALGDPDRLLQRRGRRLPRRPAGPARGGEGAGRGRRRPRRARCDRRGRLRLGSRR